MGRQWTKTEEEKYRSELIDLYVRQNKTIREVGLVLSISEQTVFKRLQRLGINSCRQLKDHYQNQRGDVVLPTRYNEDLAEFFGIMLGDGHVSYFQVIVSLGNKELLYAEYVVALIQKVFGTKAKIALRADGYRDIYVGSTLITKWLLEEGLVCNKVKEQVDIPDWLFLNKEYMQGFLRGFFDTDGSVYRLKFGIQISLTNHSSPILKSLQRMLFSLGYTPSNVSVHKVYITRREQVVRFFREIQPQNPKHIRRFEEFILRRSDSGHSRTL